MTDDLPGDDVLDEDLASAEADADHSTPEEASTTDEKRADRFWGILLGGLPLLLLGLVCAVSGLILGNVWLIGAGGVGFFIGFLAYASSWLPPGVVLWRRLLMKSLKNYKSAASADAIGFVFRGSGSIDPRAVKYLGSDTEDQEGKWATKSTGEKWGAGVEGSAVNLLGKTPVAFFDEEDPDRVTSKYGRAAEAVDMGQTRPLYTNVQVDEVVAEKAIYPPGTNPEEAIADGGHVEPEETQVLDREYRVQGGGQLVDVLIDLSSPEGTSGGRISFEKAKELRAETATTEEMQRQEDRGRISELKRGADRKFVLKVLLIAAGIIGIVYLGPMLIESLFSSGGGGGGGGVMPFSIAPALQAIPTALGVV